MGKIVGEPMNRKLNQKKHDQSVDRATLPSPHQLNTNFDHRISSGKKTVWAELSNSSRLETISPNSFHWINGARQTNETGDKRSFWGVGIPHVSWTRSVEQGNDPCQIRQVHWEFVSSVCLFRCGQLRGDWGTKWEGACWGLGSPPPITLDCAEVFHHVFSEKFY